MFDNSFILFKKDNRPENNPDFCEKLGKIGLGLLNIAVGKTATVRKISGITDKTSFKVEAYSTSARVAALALFILASPITIPLAHIGFVGTAFSSSYEETCDLYNQRKRAPTIGDTRADATPEDRAATTIQKHFRGYHARKPHLPSSLYPQYHAQVEKISGPESKSIPQAEAGKTRVYLPEEMSGVVLKYSGREQAIERFHQMQEVRAVLESQNSSHLVIPRANLCEDCLVEERLPISEDSYHNMGLYLSEPELFNEAVRELTKLFSRVYLSDLVDLQPNPLGHIAGVEDFVRYDNLPLYVVEENGKREGKIGLIDLEHIEKGPNPQGLKTLARIFPLHLDLIKQEARELEMEINETALDACAEKGRKYLQVGFTDHLEWLKKKGVSAETPLQPFQVSPKRVEEVTALVEKELLKLHESGDRLFRPRYLVKFPEDLANAASEEGVKRMAAHFTSFMINGIKNQVRLLQEKMLAQIQAKEMTESQLVGLRSLVIQRPRPYGATLKIEIEKQLTSLIMDELVQGGEVFYFDPAFYTGGHHMCWIRY